MAKPLSFKNFIKVEYRPGEDDQTNYNAQQRRKEDVEQEALNYSQRRARARNMKKIKAKLKMGRKRAQMKSANLPRLKKRARKQAINTLFKKFSKGKSRSELPPARRQEIEKRISKMGARLDRMTQKQLIKTRALEKERKASRNKKEK